MGLSEKMLSLPFWENWGSADYGDVGKDSEEFRSFRADHRLVNDVVVDAQPAI